MHQTCQITYIAIANTVFWLGEAIRLEIYIHNQAMQTRPYV
jgi:hypothetical protein